MLFLSQPLGVGFSYSTETAGTLNPGESGNALDYFDPMILALQASVHARHFRPELTVGCS